MVICGLKLTHDGAISVIDNGRLAFCIEMEKIENNLRYKSIDDTSKIPGMLEENGYDISDIDFFSVDGWRGEIKTGLEIGEVCNNISYFDGNELCELSISSYEEEALKHDILQPLRYKGLMICGKEYDYYSFLHITGHVMSAYCTSDFAKRNESSFILVWDGGMYPRLYYYNAQNKSIENIGTIFLLVGNIYTIFSLHFGPFKAKDKIVRDNLSVAGKVMAYIALGEERRELFKFFDELLSQYYQTPMNVNENIGTEYGKIVANEFNNRIMNQGYSDEDILATFHVYLEEMLIEKLAKKINKYGKKCRNLCITGGCALNIKWNSAIRNSGLFDNVYVPPFPNDSGSAIGTASCMMFHQEKRSCLDWNVYSGPMIINNKQAEGWIKKQCSLKELAKLIYEQNEPVVFLNGKAELGPRALGNRSIFAAAVTMQMKDILNAVKQREAYRPISPICLESLAKDIFEPGINDPYMLFDHIVKKEWLDRIPAICHLDNTARLQTINIERNPIVAELLHEYEKISGIPLLCNTSANYKGCGFFPDIYSATNWNKVNFVWCENILYEKVDKVRF